MLDTGDSLVGGSSRWGDNQLGDRTEGAAVIAAMNLMGYDAMALGPLDLAVGGQALAERISEAKFPILSANVFSDSTGRLLARPYALVPEGDVRVAIVGLTRVPDEPLPGFRVTDPSQAAAKAVAEAAQQAQTVILLANLDYQSALALAENLLELNLVIAAQPAQLPQAAERTAKGALVVAAERPDSWASGHRIGRMLGRVNSGGRFSDEQCTSILLDRTIADDGEMTPLLEHY